MSYEEVIEEREGLTLKIAHDQSCESPLDMDCNSGVFITYRAGGRYTLGNKPVDAEEDDEIRQRIEKGEVIGLAVQAYIHSGVALKASAHNPFPDARWDSGRSGWVYVEKKTALEWMMAKRVTKKVRERVEKSLASVVDEFSKWLDGECYGYVIEDENEDHVDSCWGFIGRDYAIEQGEAALKSALEYKAEERRKRWRGALKEARERRYWAARDVMTEARSS